MTVTGSPFCAHKKLRTSCPECRPPPPPAPPPKAAKAPKRERDPDVEGTPRGPTSMMPKKTRPKRVNDRAEAESAEAWWVKKR